MKCAVCVANLAEDDFVADFGLCQRLHISNAHRLILCARDKSSHCDRNDCHHQYFRIHVPNIFNTPRIAKLLALIAPATRHDTIRIEQLRQEESFPEASRCAESSPRWRRKRLALAYGPCCAA